MEILSCALTSNSNNQKTSDNHDPPECKHKVTTKYHIPEEVEYLYTLWSVQFNMRNITFNKEFKSNLQLSIK